MFELSWLDIILRICFSVVVGGIIGMEREHKSRPAGMRTNVLVCLGACIVALMECLLRRDISAASADGITLSVGRLSAQVISGIGFLGAGTIFMAQKKITGLTTAAGLWTVGCMGLLIGYGYYWVAGACCVLVIIVLTFMQKVVKVNAIKRVEVRFIHRAETLAFINEFYAKHNVQILDVDFHVETMADGERITQNIYTNIYTLHLPSNFHYMDIANEFSEHPNILVVRTTNA